MLPDPTAALGIFGAVSQAPPLLAYVALLLALLASASVCPSVPPSPWHVGASSLDTRGSGQSFGAVGPRVGLTASLHGCLSASFQSRCLIVQAPFICPVRGQLPPAPCYFPDSPRYSFTHRSQRASCRFAPLRSWKKHTAKSD